MAFQIKNDSQQVLFEENIPFEVEKLHSPQLIEEKQELKYAFGEAKFREMYFDGCHIALGDAQVYENLHIAATDGLPTVSLFFLVHGQFDTEIRGRRGKHRFSSLEHNLMYNPHETDETADIYKQANLEVLMLGFTRERFLEMAVNNGRTLDTLAEKISNDKAIFLNKNSNQPITTRMLMIIDEIRKCEFSGGLKKLFMQSKALELLALQCEQYERATEISSKPNRISATDKEKIYHARDLLLAQLQEPPSLQQLSRLAGLNEFKLKTGFKEVFDNTVYGYLNDHRMEHARQQVLEGNRSLTDIAGTLGFSSIQHFSNAFRKKYGVSPGKMR
jgi:AraC family transcriptional regulator, transcriptional activator of the genes for pyochelin and ferripyochelin receptors